MRTGQIQAASQIPIEVDLADEAAPLFQQIAARASALHKEGLSDRAIGRALGVDQKTAAKAIRWLDQSEATRPPES
jgi:hypothetical protein